MENENKPVKENTEKKNNRRGHHGKSHKSHGYFITPPDGQEQKKNSEAQKKEKSVPEQKPQSTVSAPAKAEGSKQKSGNRNNRRRRRGRGHGNQKAQKPIAEGQQKQQDRNAGGKQQKESATPADAQARQKSHQAGHPSPRYSSSLTLREHLDDPSELLAKEVEEEETIDPALISPDVLETPRSMPVVDDTVPRVEVVGIRFKSTGKVYYFDPVGKSYARGSYAIVETARGLEYGEIAMSNTTVKETDVVPPLRPILREATKADHARHEENKKKEAEALTVCAKKIAEHKLDMKLIEAQYTFDNSKLLFYFTSAGRVD
ncbi:MAG: hypothetical protein E7606_05735, partial [Ruminococcaceae bacterium]|nr:hypothetical protein [Oscillospiraceae bacterium]